MANRYIPKKLKQEIIQLAKLRCEYCQSLMANAIHKFEIDHIHPFSIGGETILKNLALSCGGCNNAKHQKTIAKDPVTKLVVRLYHPRNDNWFEHFTWSNDFLKIIGISSIGRATIKALDINRLGVMNFRRINILANEHPPKDLLP